MKYYHGWITSGQKNVFFKKTICIAYFVLMFGSRHIIISIIVLFFNQMQHNFSKHKIFADTLDNAIKDIVGYPLLLITLTLLH